MLRELSNLVFLEQGLVILVFNTLSLCFVSCHDHVGCPFWDQ
uniref:Uncharacterized protein n=1 Tax=Rhizophora mucronata TaxID=61149 RepID=A0A2P2NBG2_RHIMU